MPSNFEAGRVFCDHARNILEGRYQQRFETDVALAVGNPPKLHKFDLVSNDHRIVCECKAYAWTASGNIPSAKISNLREAVQFLSALAQEVVKVLILKRSLRIGYVETLAQYFARLNGYLLGSIVVIEIDTSTQNLTTVHGVLPP